MQVFCDMLAHMVTRKQRRTHLAESPIAAKGAGPQRPEYPSIAGCYGVAHEVAALQAWAARDESLSC